MVRSFVAVALIAAPLAASAVAQPLERSPLLGTWAVDVTRLPVPPEARPKSVTFKFNEAGDGKWTTDVDIKGGDGSDRHSIATFALDGTGAVIEGDQAEADTVAATLPQPNVMVMELGRGGIPASTRVYTVARGGQTMIETAAYFGRDGKPVMRTNYFSRVR